MALAADLSRSIAGVQTRVGVIGGGAWGTALAAHCARMGHDTLLWAIEKDVVDDVNGDDHENKRYLKGIKLPEALRASGDLRAVVDHAELVVMVVPTPFVASTLAPVADAFRPGDQILVSCTKGILNDTLETVNQILTRVLPEPFHPKLAYLSGPSFAAEVAQAMPTAVTIASHSPAVATRTQAILSTPRFRGYTSNDVVGVELGGALKNVLAIACGICDGAGFGNNGRAALITRGLDEINRLAVALGANPLTLAGLAGVGDAVLTCTGDLSRNRTVGMRIGKGEKLPEIQASMGGAVAEGVLTSRSAYMLCKKINVECPVLEGIFHVVHEGADPFQQVLKNMSRDLKPEIDSSLLQASVGAKP